MKAKATAVAEHIRELLNQKENITVAIDGRCAAGKTTLAAELQKTLNCNVIHADSFFLRPEQRTPERYATPGENIDHERLLAEVLIPLSRGDAFCYSPFNCKTQSLDEKICVPKKAVTVIEGSYCCHPSLADLYDLKVFLDVDEKTQKERILSRNPDNFEMFFKKWIPLEELYISTFSGRKVFDLYIE